MLRECDRAKARLGHLDLVLAAASLRPAVFLQQLIAFFWLSVPFMDRATEALRAAEAAVATVCDHGQFVASRDRAAVSRSTKRSLAMGHSERRIE